MSDVIWLYSDDGDPTGALARGETPGLPIDGPAGRGEGRRREIDWDGAQSIGEAPRDRRFVPHCSKESRVLAIGRAVVAACGEPDGINRRRVVIGPQARAGARRPAAWAARPASGQDRDAAAAWRSGESVETGLRPEHLSAGSEAGHPTERRGIERRGGAGYVFCVTPERLARTLHLAGQTALRRSAQTRIAIGPEFPHVFIGSDGRALRRFAIGEAAAA